MSTINVDIVLPQSTPRVTVGGAIIEYDANRNLTIGENISDLMTGYDNTVVGNNSMIVATTAGNNTAIGANVLNAATSAASNVGIGHSVLSSLTIGGENVAIGSGAMIDSINGISNVAIGSGAFALGTSGNDNVVVGRSAGISTSGNSNVYIGSYAAHLQTSGNNNITIGYQALNTTNTVSNQITLGNSSHNLLRCAVTSITSLSDARDKSNVEDSTYGLELVKALRPVTFEWDTRDGAKKGVKDLGFIAQELQSVDDEHLSLVYDENPDKLEATYGRLIPVLVKAIQELTAKVEALEAK